MESLTPKGSTLLEGSSSSNFQQAEGVSIPRDLPLKKEGHFGSSPLRGSNFLLPAAAISTPTACWKLLLELPSSVVRNRQQNQII
jgi:hypothetical protein